MTKIIPNNNNNDKVWLNKLNMYSQDLFLYKQRLNEASKAKTNEEVIIDAIKLERKINDFLKQNEIIKHKIKNITIENNQSNNLSIDDYSPIIDKLDLDYNELRKVMLSFIAKIMD